MEREEERERGGRRECVRVGMEWEGGWDGGEAGGGEWRGVCVSFRLYDLAGRREERESETSTIDSRRYHHCRR